MSIARPEERRSGADPLRHHADCEYWHDQYSNECTCGLTAPRPAWSVLTPKEKNDEHA
jgi:hypothetical protein